jgi:hypothetical protein
LTDYSDQIVILKLWLNHKQRFNKICAHSLSSRSASSSLCGMCNNTVKPVLRGHLWSKRKKRSFKIGDLLNEVQFRWNFLWQDKKKATFNTGDCLIEMNAWFECKPITLCNSLHFCVFEHSRLCFNCQEKGDLLKQVTA